MRGPNHGAEEDGVGNWQRLQPCDHPWWRKVLNVTLQNIALDGVAQIRTCLAQAGGATLTDPQARGASQPGYVSAL